MKATEVRIGNLVSKKYDEPFADAWYWAENPIIANDFEGIEKFPNNYKGVLLTEERLIRLGAIQYTGRKDMFSLYGYVLVITEDKDVMFIKGNMVCELVLAHYKYVHQLQNAIQALTGIELTYKI